MKKTLIVGGAGFIGARLTARLVAAGDHVTVLDRVSPSIDGATGWVADVNDLDDLRRLADFDRVAYLASVVGVKRVLESSSELIATNVITLHSFLDALREHGNCEHLMFFSTSEVYGSSDHLMSEGDPVSLQPPSNVRGRYAASKFYGEHLVSDWSLATGVASTCIRPFNVYGPGRRDYAIEVFCKAALANESVQIEGDGSDVRAWCYVDDFVEYVAELLGNPEGSRVFNVGNDDAAYSTADLCSMIIQAAGGGSMETGLAYPGGSSIRRRIPDLSYLRSITNYRPRTSLESGIAQTVEWFAAGT